MKIFEEMEKRGHEELIFSYNESTNLKAIIALHDTTLGKSVGGIRMSCYENDDAAVAEALRLSQIMTYQSATADVDCGGGAIVLQGNPITEKSEAFFRALGRFLESLKGRLVIFPDLGTDASDFRYIQRESIHTIFSKTIADRSKPSAQITAYGVYWGIKACAKMIYGSPSLNGLTFAVQGLGNVGKFLVQYLKQEDTHLVISDLIYDNIKEIEDKYPDTTIVRPNEILNQEVDFFVPCAKGNLIDADILKKMHCRVIAGAAYSVFKTDNLIEQAHEHGILYAPDFVISAGDLFHLNDDLKLTEIEQALEGAQIIYDVMLQILKRAQELKVSPYSIALEQAHERYQKIDRIKDILC